MATRSTSFAGLKLSGLPLLNIRLEFNYLLALFRVETFRQQFRGDKGRSIPIRSHSYTWHGRTEVLLSHVLRDAIVGLESAVSGAVFVEALAAGTMTPEIREATKDPIRVLPERGSAACVYNGLPGLIDDGYRMEAVNEPLWDRLRLFYKEVRNPLFHAYEVHGADPDPVWHCLELLWEGFQWLNGWHPVERLLEGPIRWADNMAERIREVPRLRTADVDQIAPPYAFPKGRGHLDYLPEDMAHVAVQDVLGMYLPSEAMVDLTTETEDGGTLKLEMSAGAAMKALGFLALAKEKRGWAIPDRLW